MTTRWAVAADLGATEIKAGIVSSQGALVGPRMRPTRPERGPASVLDSIAEAIAELLQDCAVLVGDDPTAVGLAVPGIVDDGAGVARVSANIGWQNLPIAAALGADLHRRVWLGQDVRSGGLAEAHAGSGVGYRSTLFVPLGTGIGISFVDERGVLTGATWSAGELGHLIVRPDGEPCPCGGRGCLETVASAAAIARSFGRATGIPATAQEVAAAVRRGDATAARIWDEAMDALADALAVCVLLLDPGVIVLGGGLAGSADLLLEPIGSRLASRMTFRGAPPVVGAAFGEWAGCVGAGLDALAREARATGVPA